MAYQIVNQTSSKQDPGSVTPSILPTLEGPRYLEGLGISQAIDFEDFDEYDDSVDLGISTKTLQTTFGREEDYIELHIRNTAGQLIYSESNFQDYGLNENKNSILFDPEKILSDRGYISGQYFLKIHLH